MSTLFRSEALEGRRNALDGEVIMTRSVPLWAMTGLLSAITVVTATWVGLGSYTRTETVPGSLAPDQALAKIFADRPGRVIWLGVKDGDVASAGQPMATVRLEQTLSNGRSPGVERLASVAEQAKLTIEQLKLEGENAAAERLRLQRLINELGNEHGQLATQIDLQRQAVESTHVSLSAVQKLVDVGFETHTSLEQRRQAWLTASAQLQSLIQQVAQLAERSSDAEAELLKLPEEHAAKMADLHSTLDGLDQRRVEVESARSYTITAPITGRVTSVQTAAGRSSDGRLPLLAVVPLGAAMQATLYAPSKAMGMARPGQQVRLMYDAFPYQRFGASTGRIIAISQSVLTPEEVDAPVKVKDPIYEMRVRLDDQHVRAFGQNLVLQPGMTLTADIVLDRRSFLHWLLEPVRAVEARS